MFKPAYGTDGDKNDKYDDLEELYDTVYDSSDEQK